MADLIDRLSGESEPDRPKIPVHQFMGAFRGYVAGIITVGEISTAWDLQGDEGTQATALKNNIDAESGVADKIAYVLKVEAVSFLIEYHEDSIYHSAGSVDKDRVKTDLGW